MPRTAKGGGRKKPPERPPQEEYTNLEWHKQFVCWNYFRYIESGGQEGWNPAEAGSVFHYRSSEYVASLGTESWFRHLAKQMVTLAQKFASLNQIPPRPPLGHTNQSSNSSFGANPPPLPALSPLPRAAPGTMQSPAGLRSSRGAHPHTPPAPPRAAAAARQNAERGGHFDLSSNFLKVPTSFGMWRNFNYTTRVTTVEIQIRMILHNGVDTQDIQFEWLNSRQLKLMVAWPEWFQYAELMATFTLNEEGKPLYRHDHPLTMDASERNQSLVEEDSRVWDEGVLDFEQDMKTEDPNFELLQVDIPSKNRTVNVLQFILL
jgi:hypothetical protein